MAVEYFYDWVFPWLFKSYQLKFLRSNAWRRGAYNYTVFLTTLSDVVVACMYSCCMYLSFQFLVNIALQFFLLLASFHIKWYAWLLVQGPCDTSAHLCMVTACSQRTRHYPYESRWCGTGTWISGSLVLSYIEASLLGCLGWGWAGLVF